MERLLSKPVTRKCLPARNPMPVSRKSEHGAKLSAVAAMLLRSPLNWPEIIADGDRAFGANRAAVALQCCHDRANDRARRHSRVARMWRRAMERSVPRRGPRGQYALYRLRRKA